MDTPIKQLETCGLRKPSIIRFKFFTLDNRLIRQKIGELSTKDKPSLKKNFTQMFKDFF